MAHGAPRPRHRARRRRAAVHGAQLPLAGDPRPLLRVPLAGVPTVSEQYDPSVMDDEDVPTPRLEELQAFARELRVVLEGLVALGEASTGDSHRALIARVDDLQDRVLGYARSPVDNRLALADLRRRVEDLEEAERRRGFRPWYGY